MLLERLIKANFAASDRLDRLLPPKLTIDGNRDFQQHFAWQYIRSDMLIYDIGGGKQPFLTPAKKRELRARVVGLDVSATELGLAPRGSYDDVLISDIQRFRGNEEADLAICQAVLEHVSDVAAAMCAISTILKPGGHAIIFVPCRNAAFAVLNRILPESLKRQLLFAAFPDARDAQGFPSYYDRCTPKGIAQLAEKNGMTPVDLRKYYSSGYFRVLLPAQVIWRLWSGLAGLMESERFCETFSLALKKR